VKSSLSRAGPTGGRTRISGRSAGAHPALVGDLLHGGGSGHRQGWFTPTVATGLGGRDSRVAGGHPDHL